MTTNRKLAIAGCLGLLLLAVLVIVALGWIGVLLGLVGLALAVTLRTLVVKRSPAVAEPEANVAPLVTAGRPTADDQVFLNLTATIHWTAAGGESHHVDLARDAILRRARTVTQRRQPAQMPLAQHELAARVAVPEAAQTLTVWATDIKLELPAAVQQHLAKMAEAHRDGLLWQVGLENERRIREYLRNEALKSPDAAVVWWFARNQGSVERAVELADVLTQLSDLATGRAHSDDAPNAHSLISAIAKLAPTAQRRTADELAETLERIGLAADAIALRQRFEVTHLSRVAKTESPLAAPESTSAADG